ncbi:anti-sigma factor family protein [Pseudomonas sp. NPDC089554]|uniref:anti-sigma factor family protein n=1 Tax=Pseudomonas sp. NPDC089554 TaxID=3390653 RepID=UPI003D036FDF
MTTTVADDALLIAYVEGELSPQQCEEIEQLMNASPELAERVALLMSSALPYSEAFARQSIPPVPQSLVRSVDALLAQHGVSSAAPASAPSQPPESLLTRLFGRPKFGWLAVAFSTGAICCGLVLQGGFLGGAANTDSALQQAPVVAQVQASPWVTQAANYQRLYSRDTINHVTLQVDDIRKTLADIREIDGMELRVPDLSAQGLSFKRVQRLRFNNKALIQLVYLPEHGEPVALCVMKEPKPDQSIAELDVAGMDVVVWRQSQLGYALIGAPKDVDLKAVARTVAERSSGQLYTAKASALSPFLLSDIASDQVRPLAP